MNTAAFNISLSDTIKLVKRLGLFRMSGTKSINKDGVTTEFKDAAHGKDYVKAYRVGIENFDYDFLLIDNSFFQYSMSFNTGRIIDINYSFYHNPFNFVPFSKYVDQMVQEGRIENSAVLLLEDYLHELYIQFLTEQPLSSQSTLIRYDYDVAHYKALIHPSSHIHIGNNKSLRIPCSKLLTPYQFTLFVLRHLYYDTWITLINPIESGPTIYKKNRCPELEATLWSDIEKIDLYLT